MHTIVDFFLQILIFIYKNIAFYDLGIAIIILTLFIRIILLPFFYKSAKDQTIIQKLQPYIKEIQKNHKDDIAKQGEKMMELYKKYKVNPLSSILLILLQIPIFLALFNLFSKEIMVGNYFNSTYFLNWIDLTQKNFLIVLLAALFQYAQNKILLQRKKDKTLEAKFNNFFILLAPIITILIFMNLPSALSLYWMTFSAFSFLQQVYINKNIKIENLEKELK
jgi:YidC/Oxa1 family membrane protein insertase